MAEFIVLWDGVHRNANADLLLANPEAASEPVVLRRIPPPVVPNGADDALAGKLRNTRRFFAVARPLCVICHRPLPRFQRYRHRFGCPA